METSWQWKLGWIVACFIFFAKPYDCTKMHRLSWRYKWCDEAHLTTKSALDRQSRRRQRKSCSPAPQLSKTHLKFHVIKLPATCLEWNLCWWTSPPEFVSWYGKNLMFWNPPTWDLSINNDKVTCTYSQNNAFWRSNVRRHKDDQKLWPQAKLNLHTKLNL